MAPHIVTVTKKGGAEQILLAEDDRNWIMFKGLFSDILDEVVLIEDNEFKEFIRGKLKGIWCKKANKLIEDIE